MKKNNTSIHNMYDGPLLPVTMKLAIPFFLSNFFNLFYMVVDTFFITRIDMQSTALISGTGLVFPIFYFFISLSVGISIGVSTLVARGIGEDNEAAIERGADSGLLVGLILTCVLIPAGFVFGREILHFLAGSKMSAEAMDNSMQYLYFLLPGMGLLLLGHVLIGVLQGEGLTKHIAIASVISTALNLVLDPIFIFLLDMGVAGAGFATTVSLAVTAIYMISIFVKEKSSIPIGWNILLARRKLVMEIIRIGSLQSLGMLSVAVTFMFLNNLVSSISENAMNSWALCGRTDHFLLIPAFAISGATITMTGQNYGRNNLERVKSIFRWNLLVSLGFVFVFAVIYNFTAHSLFSLFSSVPSVIEGSVRQVHYISFTFLGVTTGIISSSVFQATGRPVPAFLITLFRMCFVAVPLAFFLVYIYDQGIIGVFLGLAAGNFLALPLSLVWTMHHLKNLRFNSVT